VIFAYCFYARFIRKFINNKKIIWATVVEPSGTDYISRTEAKHNLL